MFRALALSTHFKCDLRACMCFLLTFKSISTLAIFLAQILSNFISLIMVILHVCVCIYPHMVLDIEHFGMVHPPSYFRKSGRYKCIEFD